MSASKKSKKIFSEQGEPKFREMEKDVLGDLVNLRSHVLSVGGGAVIKDENWSLLRDLGVTVFLDTPPDEIARRLTLHPEEIQYTLRYLICGVPARVGLRSFCAKSVSVDGFFAAHLRHHPSRNHRYRQRVGSESVPGALGRAGL
jgi:hypothetical protein